MEDKQKKLLVSVPAGLAGAILMGLFTLFMFRYFAYALTLPEGILTAIVLAVIPVCLEGLLKQSVNGTLMDVIMIIGSFLLTVLYALQAGGNAYTVRSILKVSGLLHACAMLVLLLRLTFRRVRRN